MPRDDEQAEAGGAPTWMLTYSDTITLLLTFFVMLLTFSTPNKEDFGRLGFGLLQGFKGTGSGMRGPPVADNQDQSHRLAASRVNVEGSEKPPLNTEAPLGELKKQYGDLDISKLQDLKGAVCVRLDLVDLFGTGTELTPEGKAALDLIVRITRGKSFSIVVRVESRPAPGPAERQARSTQMGSRIVRYLGESAGAACRDIGLSDNVELSDQPLPEGQCEILMLEV
jgi:chemotaxis protein MotB